MCEIELLCAGYGMLQRNCYIIKVRFLPVTLLCGCVAYVSHDAFVRDSFQITSSVSLAHLSDHIIAMGESLCESAAAMESKAFTIIISR